MFFLGKWQTARMSEIPNALSIFLHLMNSTKGREAGKKISKTVCNYRFDGAK